MEVNFKFEIGDVVYHKATMEQYRAEMKIYPNRFAEGKFGAPRLMIVNQRTMEQCPGGTQYQYACRNWNGASQDKTLTQFNEIEIAKWDVLAWFDEVTAVTAEALAKQSK